MQQHYSHELAWEDAPPSGRRETFLAALRRLTELCPGPVCIVDTGTIRSDTFIGRDGDGWSTLTWGWYAAQTGSRVHTVDVQPAAVAVCRRVTAAYAAAIEYACADSVDFLRQWVEERRGEIQLLYLDSLDYFDRDASEAHCLAEAQAACPSHAAPCLVLLDDTWMTAGSDRRGIPRFAGKAARAAPFLLRQGCQVDWAAASQVLLSRSAFGPRPRG